MNEDTDAIPPCQTVEDEEFARKHGYNLMEVSNNPNETKCPRRCKQTVWNVKIVYEPSPGIKDNMALLYLSNTMKKEHSEEVLINDANTVIASLGGSLGLFLGVSCFSVMTLVGRKLATLKSRNVSNINNQKTHQIVVR